MRKILASLFVLPLLFASGCGSGLPETAPVRGVVQYEGKPLSGFKNAAVILTPVAGRPGKSVISPTDGSFELTTYNAGDGARLGPNKVTVSATVEDRTKSDDRYPGVRFIIPVKFSERDTSGMEYDVKPGSNVIQIQLRADGTGTVVAQ